MTREGGLLLGILLGAVGALGCDRLTVVNFAGSKVQLTIAGADPTPAGQHLELWARNGDQHLVRMLAGTARDDATTPGGLGPGQAAYKLVPAVDLADPCMIDAAGHLLWKPEAQPGPSDTQRKNQATAVENRIRALAEGTPLLALVSWDDGAAAVPTLAADAPAAERLQKCTAYWAGSPAAYSGNPFQVTAPVHGILFGMLDYTSVLPKPPQVLGGIQIVSDFALRDLRELWFTQTAATLKDLDPDQLDCAASPTTCRGAIFLQGSAGKPDRGIFRFDLAPTQPGVRGRGTAAVYTRLDEDPVQF